MIIFYNFKKKKMFKSALLAIGLIANSVSASSKCSVTVSTYSDDTCTTSKEVLPLYENGVANIAFTFHQCWSQTGSNGDTYLQMWMCDPEHFVAFGRYRDVNCMTYDTPAVVGYTPDYCQIEDSSTWVKVTNVELTGNKYGIGYGEAWGIFICQTVLFGLCAGYE